MPSAKGTSSRAVFDSDKEKFIIEALLRQTESGKRADSGWKKEAWNAVLLALNKQFSVVYTVNQIKNKVDNVRMMRVYIDTGHLRLTM